MKNTISYDINVPKHDPRTSTPLFEHTRKQLIERDKGCFVCGSTIDLQAHHHPIEWSLALMIDWSADSQIRKDFPNFDWASFNENEPYTFVDNMLVNGLLLCKEHHIGADTGIHDLPYPNFIAQRYGKAGYKFNDKEILHHG